MRLAQAAAIILLAAIVLPSLPGAPAAAEGERPVSLTAIPPPGGETETESVVLSARIASDNVELPGQPITFYIVTTVFGERLMKVGEAISDFGGTASVVYSPTWTGDHTVVAHFDGAGEYAEAETSFHFDAIEAESAYEPAVFGLEPIRAALPFGVGLAVLVIWGALGFALVNTVIGVRAAGRAEPQPVAATAAVFIPPSPPSEQSDATKRLAMIVAVLVVVLGVPLIWATLRVTQETDEDQVVVDGSVPGHDHVDVVPGEPLPVTLVQSVQTVEFDENGQPTPGSIPVPADLGITAGRVRILDSTGGRIVTVSPDGELIPIQQGTGVDGTTLKGSQAMSALGERLFIANATGDRIAVVDESGLIEGSILPALPAGANPISIAGIVASHTGRMWLSDVANHRVILIDSHGGFELVVGTGGPASGEEGFNSPTGVALDEDENLYVSDTGNGVVKKYSPLGVLLQVIGEGRLQEPQGVTVSNSGRIFVADTAARNVSIFAPDGSLLGTVTDPGFEEPHIVRVDDDELYVLDTLAGMLVFQALPEQVSAP